MPSAALGVVLSASLAAPGTFPLVEAARAAGARIDLQSEAEQEGDRQAPADKDEKQRGPRRWLWIGVGTLAVLGITGLILIAQDDDWLQFPSE